MTKHFYGCNKDTKDSRDIRFKAVPFKNLPPSVDLSASPFMPCVLDQGSLGSCTANAIGNCYLFVRNKQQQITQGYLPSRLFIYYNERKAEGTIFQDAGATIRTGMKVVNKYGACGDSLCPYIVENFTKGGGKDATL